MKIFFSMVLLSQFLVLSSVGAFSKDDTMLYLDHSEESFEKSIQILKKFTLFSGLKLNNDKTQVVWIGSKKNSKV